MLLGVASSGGFILSSQKLRIEGGPLLRPERGRDLRQRVRTRGISGTFLNSISSLKKIYQIVHHNNLIYVITENGHLHLLWRWRTRAGDPRQMLPRTISETSTCACGKSAHERVRANDTVGEVQRVTGTLPGTTLPTPKVSSAAIRDGSASSELLTFFPHEVCE